MSKARYLRLVIGGREADIESAETLPVAIKYSLEDRESFQKKRSSESFDITIPASINNDKIANTFHNPGIQDLTTDQHYRGFQDVLLEANGYELLVGKSLLTGATHHSCPVSYTYDLYGNNGDWAIPLTESTLYDFIKHISFELTKENIEDSWLFDGADEDLPYVFAPVRYGQAMEGGYANLVENPPPFVKDWNMKPTYMKPSLSKYWIIYWAFRSLGYRVVSDFFDSEYFRRQIMPWTWGNFLYSDGTKLDALKFLAKSTGTFSMLNQDFTGFWDLDVSNDSTNAAFDNGGTYTYDAGAKEMKWEYLYSLDFGPLEATFRLAMPVSAVVTANSDVELRVQWFKNGVKLNNGSDNGNGTLLMEINAPTIGRVDFNEMVEDYLTVQIEEGDIISAKIYLHTFDSGLGIARIHASVDNFGVEYFRLGLGSVIDFENYTAFKKYKFLDFLGGVMDEFNLAVGTDPVEKVVYFEPLHPYATGNDLSDVQPGYLNGNTLDWSDKQDLSIVSELQLYSDSDREQVFRYKEDTSDGLLKKIQDRHVTTLGMGKYVLPERFKSGTPQEITNRFFSPVIHAELSQWKGLGSDPASSPQIICLIPENVSNTSADEAQNTFAPKSVYYKGIVTDVGWVFDGQKKNSYPYAFAVNYKPGGEDDPVLSYCDERIGVEDSYVLAKGLLKRFYMQRMAIMRNGQYYSTFFRLNSFDISNVMHREHIITRGMLWELVEIDNYKPLTDESSKCFMRAWAPIEQSDINNTYPSVGSVLDENQPTDRFDFRYNPLKALPSDILIH